MTSSPRDYSAIGWEYARQVVSGEVLACKWTKLACERSLRDLDRSNKGKFPFVFDFKRASKPCRFIEHLTHVKGPKGGQHIVLEPWQCWILTQIFGWVHSEGERKGFRRFRSVHLEVARGNGKSALSSGVALYMLSADGEYGAEVYTSATGTKQARITFDDARAMAIAPGSAKLIQAAGIRVSKHAIFVPRSNSKMEPTSAKYERQDGYNVFFSLCDELHAMKDRGLYDVLVTGAGKRPESIIWAITTAGTDRSGICYERRTYLTKLLNQSATDETTFGCIWCADDEDDWQTEEAWVKANPNWRISVDPHHIMKEADVAKVMPAAQSNFKTKHCNIWVGSENPWMNRVLWDKLGDQSLDIENYKGKECFIGIDLASVSDLCSKAYLFPEMRDGKTHYTLFVKNYLSRQAVDDGRNSQYKSWEYSGDLVVTEGSATDYDQIEMELIQDTEDFIVKEVAFDPNQAQMMMQHLAPYANIFEFRQIVMNMSAPMKHIDTLVRTERLHHNGSLCLSWQMDNVVATLDNKDNIYPRKERPENKIDAVVASIMAMGRAMLFEEEDQGLLVSFI